MDVIACLLGHAKVETTERRYVKYRDKIFDDVREAMSDNATRIKPLKYKGWKALFRGQNVTK